MGLPDWLEGPVAAVLRDLQRPTPVPVSLRLHENADPELGHRLDVSENGGWGTGIWLRGERGAALTVLLAEQLQEQFFPETDAAWGEPRPDCPEHPHPPCAREIGGEAWWVCPRDERPVARIGDL